MSQKPKGIAARAGRWSAQHRKTAIFGWLALVIAAFLIGGPIGTGTKTVEQHAPGDSGRAQTIQDDAFPESTTGAGEIVLIQSKTLKANDPEYRAVVRDFEKRIGRRCPRPTSSQSPYQQGRQRPDLARQALGPGLLRGPRHAAQTKTRVNATLAVTKAVQKAHPDFNIAQFGDASSEKELMAAFEGDLQKAETLSLPITLLILLLAFGALVAAGLPLLLGLTAVIGTMGLVGLLSQLSPVSSSTSSVILLVGLAVGVDYSLFYIRREREERKAGKSKEEALNDRRGHVGSHGADLGPDRDRRHGRPVLRR